MPALHQWDYLFAFGAIFAALDAFNIGANDVANSFATSVASRSLTMKQAVFAAACCEFAGAVLVGARVADTIKNGIIPNSIFNGNAGVQLLAFTVALTVSATWLTIATRNSWPVSTTYSIVSAVAGVGVAIGPTSAVNWGWNNGKGLGAIWSGLVLAPGMAAGFAAIIYLLVKFGVLARKDPVKWGLITSPLFFFLVTSVLTLSIVFKGSPSLNLDELSEGAMAAAIVGTAAVVSILSILFWLPYVYCKVVRKDYTLRFYHFFMGPLLWRRPTPADAGTIGVKSSVPDYRVVRDADGVETRVPTAPSSASHDGEDSSEKGEIREAGDNVPAQPSQLNKEVEKPDLHPIVGPWAEPKNLWIIMRYKSLPFLISIFTHGTSIDIHELQAGKVGTAEHERMSRIHAAAKQYPNEVEHLYSFMQVLTACTASFAHGANDVANAIGPFSVIYQVWSTGDAAASKAPVPVWILAAGGAFIVLGLATYGYNIMAVLGNKITLMSPSRGFTMELGAAITVILASQYGLPVSTTMCITGATLGVSLCNGDIRATNWRALGWIFLGWVLTVPVVGVASGCLMSIILYAPRLAV